ncbi:uncharacterized protein LOC116085231 [Mastomys coucha]|uniref:uncharacterized protein LOC116085231 n=1 Tax=Mastomys coucha TaxID=35658 RepID=UPI001261B17F|nr:uncharacterized protein LOC116085231 [Mastomys coucha]
MLLCKRHQWPALDSRLWWYSSKKRTAGPTTPGPANIWGSRESRQRTESGEMANISPSERPRRATADSAGLDLHSTTRLILTPQMGVQLIETDFKGPLEPDTVGLLLGRSSSALRGLIVHPGVIDPDYTGVVKIMVASPHGITAISPGDRIAQLVILLSLHDRYVARDQDRGKGGFGSTGTDLIFLSLDLDQCPVLELKVDGKKILGLLDTGADRSIIAKKDWPSGWPVQASSQTLQGLGYAKTPDMSARQSGRIRKVIQEICSHMYLSSLSPFGEETS